MWKGLEFRIVWGLGFKSRFKDDSDGDASNISNQSPHGSNIGPWI